MNDIDQLPESYFALGLSSALILPDRPILVSVRNFSDHDQMVHIVPHQHGDRLVFDPPERTINLEANGEQIVGFQAIISARERWRISNWFRGTIIDFEFQGSAVGHTATVQAQLYKPVPMLPSVAALLILLLYLALFTRTIYVLSHNLGETTAFLEAQNDRIALLEANRVEISGALTSQSPRDDLPPTTDPEEELVFEEEVAEATQTQSAVSTIDAASSLTADASNENPPLTSFSLVSDTYSTEESQVIFKSATVGVLANDNVDEEDLFSVTAPTASQNGQLIMDDDGGFTYQPDSGFFGNDFFEYSVCIAPDVCKTSRVKIIVSRAVNVVLAESETLTIDETDVAIDVTALILENDSDRYAQNLTIQSVDAAASSGVVEFDATSGRVRYTPGAFFANLSEGQIGSDSFVYTVTDGLGHSDVATVTINVRGVNSRPVANADSVSNLPDSLRFDEDDTPRDLTDILLANDVDPENGTFTPNSVNNNGDGGSATIDNGRINYSLGAAFQSLGEGEIGTDEFTYTIVDDDGLVSEAITVSLEIVGVNDAPTLNIVNAAMPLSYSTVTTASIPIAESVTISDVDDINMIRVSLEFVGVTPRPDGENEFVQIIVNGQLFTGDEDLLWVSTSPQSALTFEEALQTAAYRNISVDGGGVPNATHGCREIQITVSDEWGLMSEAFLVQIEVGAGSCNVATLAPWPQQVAMIAREDWL